MKLKAGRKNQVFFMTALLVVVLLAFTLVHRAYEYGPIRSFVMALTISWVPMQLIARTLERRWLWPPSSQFTSFFWGDSVLLPGIVVMIAMMFQRLPEGNYWFQNRTWLLVCALIGLIGGLVFHSMDSDYSQAQLNSPAKLFHDLVAVPVFTYYLLSGAPALLYARNLDVIISLSAVAVFIAFLYLVRTDDPSRKDTAHIDYDWARMHPK